MKKFCSPFLLFSLLFLSGCRYHAGYPIHHSNIKTVYVAPAVKKALVAQMSGVLTQQIRNEILRNGNLHLADKNHADVLLETTITHYGRSIGTVEEYDTDKARTFALNAQIECSLKDVKTGHYYFKAKQISASISINANTAAQAIEYQKQPQLTRELAKKVAMLIANIDTKNKPISLDEPTE